MKYFLLFIALIFLFSCQSKFSTEERSFIPYKGKEVLIFKSNLGDLDTLRIQKIIDSQNRSAQMSLNPDDLLSLSVEGEFTESFNGDSEELTVEVLRIDKTNDGEATVFFDFAISGAQFYSKNNLTINEIKGQKRNKMKIGGKSYDDIVILSPISNEYSSRPHFISKLYWSLSKGYVKYDLLTGKSCELIKLE